MQTLTKESLIPLARKYALDYEAVFDALGVFLRGQSWTAASGREAKNILHRINYRRTQIRKVGEKLAERFASLGHLGRREASVYGGWIASLVLANAASQCGWGFHRTSDGFTVSWDAAAYVGFTEVNRAIAMRRDALFLLDVVLGHMKAYVAQVGCVYEEDNDE